MDISVYVILSLIISEDESEKCLLEHNSFSLIEDGHDWYMACTFSRLIAEPVLPQGFTIRSLNGEDEHDIEAYEKLYSFAPVKRSHRLTLLNSSEYSHQVVVAPDGTFAAYCEVSMCHEEWTLSGQRVGWIDYVQTSEHFQRQGLGKAIMLAGLHQLHMWRADKAMLITRSDNIPAQNTFKSVGFLYSKRDFCYVKVLCP